MSHHYVLCIGSNVSADNVRGAIEWLRGQFDVKSVSHVYQTPAVSSKPQPAAAVSHTLRVYSNAVVIGDSDISPDAADQLLKGFELRCGRDEAARSVGKVPVDIDIVIVDGEVIRPWDYRQQFFRTGFCRLSELAGTPV